MNISRYVKVALFFIVTGTAGAVYVIMSANGISQFNTKPYEVILDDATGLSTRSKVFLAGVAVGKIDAISLEGNTARIRLALLKNVEVRRNAVISRRASSILGTSMLSLDPGTELSPLLPPGSAIGAQPNTSDMNAMMGTVAELGAQISAILSEFQANQMRLLAVSLETFNSIAGKIDARADEELDRVSRLLESAAMIAERTDRLFAAREYDIDASVEDIRFALENIRQISGEIATGRGTIGQAVYDDRLYESLLSTVQETEKTIVKLQGVIDGAGDFVNRAGGMGIMVDSRANYGFLNRTIRGGASLRLNPASGDRWYRVGVNSAPDGVSTRTFTTTTGGLVEDKTETKYNVSFDAELARRFGIVTLRGGLLENTAGIGFDIQPLNQLALSGELFRFQDGAYPNLRGTVTVYPFFNPEADNPFNWVYLQGGVHDALSASRRDFFLGGGLRFSDREVRGLVGLAAGAAAVK